MRNAATATRFDAACSLFRRLQADQSGDPSNQYLLHVPHRNTAWVGAFPRRVISYDHNGFDIVTAEGRRREAPVPRPFRRLRELLDPALPCFFIISLDLQRPSCDPGLPLLRCIQPGMEAEFSGEANGLKTQVVATDPQWDEIIDNLPERELPRQRSSYRQSPAAPWESETDGRLLERLQEAVRVLQSRPAAKMIISRSCRKSIQPGSEPFGLFEIYAGSEPGAAASHFLALDEQTFSLGCSPENVFELQHGRLVFDVIASTRGRSSDPEKDRRWLLELQHDEKEKAEHLMAFERYLQRLEGLCQPGTACVEQSMGIRTLKRVRHLYSRVSGELRPELDFVDLLEDSFPPLASYPPELIPLADSGLEPTLFHGGMVGRIAPGWQDISCFLNLRSALLQHGTLHTQGGVGVIGASNPEQELLEVRNKLRSLMEAVESWQSEGPPDAEPWPG